MTSDCNPTYGGVDDILELLTKSKSLHILMVLERKGRPIRFSDIKTSVDSSSTTISRRLKELESHGLVSRTSQLADTQTWKYTITEDGKSLSPIMQSLFDWVDERNKPSAS